MKCSYLTFLILLFLSTELYSQAYTAKNEEPDKRVIVRLWINGHSTKGSGFVIGSYNDTLFIVTASHVLKGLVASKPSTAEVDGLPYPFIIVYNPDSIVEESDIALIKAYVPITKMHYCTAISDPSKCGKLFFIRADAPKPTYPASKSGIFEYWNSGDELVYSLYLREAERGDSGSALFNEGQLAGMLIESSEEGLVRVIKMPQIQKKLNRYLHLDCQLKILD